MRASTRRPSRASSPKLQALGRSASILTPEPNRVVLVTASSDDTMGRLANVLGLAG